MPDTAPLPPTIARRPARSPRKVAREIDRRPGPSVRHSELQSEPAEQPKE